MEAARLFLNRGKKKRDEIGAKSENELGRL